MALPEDQHGLHWYHYGVRYYDPQLARWHSMDPADEFHSLYVYVGNIPTIIVDVDGAQCGYDVILTNRDKQILGEANYANALTNQTTVAAVGVGAVSSGVLIYYSTPYIYASIPPTLQFINTNADRITRLLNTAYKYSLKGYIKVNNWINSQEATISKLNIKVRLRDVTDFTKGFYRGNFDKSLGIPQSINDNFSQLGWLFSQTGYNIDFISPIFNSNDIEGYVEVLGIFPVPGRAEQAH